MLVDITMALNGFVVNENPPTEGLKREDMLNIDIKITMITGLCSQKHVAPGLISTHTPAK